MSGLVDKTKMVVQIESSVSRGFKLASVSSCKDTTKRVMIRMLFKQGLRT